MQFLYMYMTRRHPPRSLPGQHIQKDVQGAVLALVVRQQDTNLSLHTPDTPPSKPCSPPLNPKIGIVIPISGRTGNASEASGWGCPPGEVASSLSLTHSHTHTHTHTHFLSFSHTLSLSHTHTHSLSLSSGWGFPPGEVAPPDPSLSLSLSLALTHTYTFSHTHSLSLSRPERSPPSIPTDS